MKTNAIVRIVLFSIAIVALLSILCVGIAAGMYMFDADSLFSEHSGTVSSSGSVAAGEIRDISIEWASGSITILRDDVEHISFSESGRFDEEKQMIWSQSGDELQIQFCKPQAYFGISFDGSKDLTITVPRDWNCGELELEVASADIKIEDLTIGTVDFDGASGTCEFRNCHVSALEMDTASGNVQFSGSLDRLDFDGASADLVLCVTNVPRSIDVDTTSGDLDLTLPEDCGFTVRLDALSGDFDSDFTITSTADAYVCGDGSCSIQVSAMSGDVCIRKAEQPKNCDH